jgi:signal transduction histidine kinase
MRANSLALRLFLSATAWTVVILVATGAILSSIYHDAVERSFDRRLGVYLRTLVADVAAPEQSADRGAPTLGEPQFELPLSGWYWQITPLDAVKPEIRKSTSLWDTKLNRLRDEDATTSPDGTTRRGYAIGPEEQRLRMLERTVDLGEDGRYVIMVAGDPQEEIDDETRAFDRALVVTFATLAVVLLLITVFQVRFGLAPLKRISEALAAIRAGTAERLEGRFPVEIAPLARETNALIDANREVVERARTHVGNLAHALKTPLSVVVNEAAGRDDPLAAKVIEQANIMRDQIARHLERARLAARLKVVGSVTGIVPIVTALTRTMEKIHQGRGIAIDLDAPAEVNFRGERQDLEEMVGNLVDNACKWAQMRVSVEVVAERHNSAAPPMVRIIVDDDGPGLSPAQRDRVARRGLRLDETKPGSGLGLSIVLELAALYGGNLLLGTAPIGGLRAELVLPAV